MKAGARTASSAEMDSMDVQTPLSTPGYIKRCQSLPSLCGTTYLASSRLSGTSVPGTNMIPQRMRYYRPRSRNRFRAGGLLYITPASRLVQARQNWKDKRIERMVGVRGFEPPTPASRTQYSTRLSYTPNQLFSNTYFCYTQLVSTSQARGQQLYAGRDIPAIRNCSENVQN